MSDGSKADPSVSFVIPANAGTQSAPARRNVALYDQSLLGPRVRGNDEEEGVRMESWAFARGLGLSYRRPVMAAPVPCAWFFPIVCCAFAFETGRRYGR